MPFENDVLTTSYPVAADLSTYQLRFVKLNTLGQVNLCGAGEAALGTLQNNPTLEDTAGVMLYGVSRIIAGEAIAAMTPVASDSEGRAVYATTGQVLGILLEAAEAPGDIVTVLLSYASSSTTTSPALTTQEVDSATGNDSASGSGAEPLASLEEAIRRVPDGYSGAYVIQLNGAGPYQAPVCYPAPGPDGKLIILADTSSPTATASPTFTGVAGRVAQYEDTGFGGPGTTEGTHWLLQDVTSFMIPGFAYFAFPCLTAAAGQVAQVTAGPLNGVPHEVHAFTTVVEFGAADSECNPATFFGCIIQGTGTNFRSRGLSFLGCRLDINLSFSVFDGAVGGVVNNVGGGALAVFNSSVENLVTRGATNQLAFSAQPGAGQVCSINGLVIEDSIDLREGVVIQQSNFVDIEGGVGYRYGQGVNANLRSHTVNAVSLISPRTGASGIPAGQGAIFGVSDAITGSCSGDAVTLQDGSIINGVSNLSGLSATGNELVMGGVGRLFSTAPVTETIDLTRAT